MSTDCVNTRDYGKEHVYCVLAGAMREEGFSAYVLGEYFDADDPDRIFPQVVAAKDNRYWDIFVDSWEKPELKTLF